MRMRHAAPTPAGVRSSDATQSTTTMPNNYQTNGHLFTSIYLNILAVDDIVQTTKCVGAIILVGCRGVNKRGSATAHGTNNKLQDTEKWNTYQQYIMMNNVSHSYKKYA